MAVEPPILSLRGASIAFGGKPLFEDAELQVSRGDRLCLVGRNGSGKSTLMKIVAGQVELDAGEVWIQPGTRIAYLPQDPPLEPGRTILDYVSEGADAVHQAEAALSRFDLDPWTDLGTLSGGEGRRAALARPSATRAPSAQIGRGARPPAPLSRVPSPETPISCCSTSRPTIWT
jgi:ATP-binding cassette subfamily F protein uup